MEVAPFFVDFHHFLSIFTIYALLPRFTFFLDLRTFSANFFWPKQPSPQHHRFFACMLRKRIDQKLLKYISRSSFKRKHLLILSFFLKRTLVLLKVLPLSCIFAYTNLITHEFLYSSSSLLNESLLHDKLWGPSQRVVTLFGIARTS